MSAPLLFPSWLARHRQRSTTQSLPSSASVVGAVPVMATQPGQDQPPRGRMKKGTTHRRTAVLVALFVLCGVLVVIVGVVLAGNDRRVGPSATTPASGSGQLTGDVSLPRDAPVQCKRFAASESIRTLPRLLPQLLTDESDQAVGSLQQAIRDMEGVPDQSASLRSAIQVATQRLRAFMNETATVNGVADLERAMRSLAMELQGLCNFPL